VDDLHAPRPTLDLRRADTGEPLGEARPVGRGELDRVAGHERAFALCNPDRVAVASFSFTTGTARSLKSVPSAVRAST
jgi:hypothetical protein